jgi:hypothetical protein
MLVDTYKKMAGTSAVFVSAQYPHASPVERDGMVWNSSELHVDDLPDDRRYKASMSNALALAACRTSPPISAIISVLNRQYRQPYEPLHHRRS